MASNEIEDKLFDDDITEESEVYEAESIFRDTDDEDSDDEDDNIQNIKTLAQSDDSYDDEETYSDEARTHSVASRESYGEASEDENYDVASALNNLPSNSQKKIKILVGNGRPGLGKSTVAMQLVAPYLFMKNQNQKVPLYTFESLSDTNMFSTHILDAVSVEVRENSFDNTFINVLTKDEHAIYDIGGGKTTQIVMEALRNTGLIYSIDLFVIPLTDGKHEGQKAKDFYDYVKSVNPDANIVFALNKVAPNACYDDVCLQYIDFLGDRNLMVDATVGMIEDVEPQDRNLVHLHNDDIIKYSVRHARTVFEFAHTDTTLTDNELREAIINNDMVRQKYLSARKTNIAKAKKYYENSIQPSIANFDRLLGFCNGWFWFI